MTACIITYERHIAPLCGHFVVMRRINDKNITKATIKIFIQCYIQVNTAVVVAVIVGILH